MIPVIDTTDATLYLNNQKSVSSVCRRLYVAIGKKFAHVCHRRFDHTVRNVRRWKCISDLKKMAFSLCSLLYSAPIGVVHRHDRTAIHLTLLCAVFAAVVVALGTCLLHTVLAVDRRQGADVQRPE